MVKNFIYYGKLDKWDYSTIIIYLILTIFIYERPEGFPYMKEWVMGYSIMSPLLLYGLNYKSMRKFNVWLVWFGFSLVHLVMYSHFSNDMNLQFMRGSAANGLQFTWVLLLLFQFNRFVSLKIQNKEVVSLSRGGTTDLWDNRKITFVDGVLFFLYYFTTIFLIIEG